MTDDNENLTPARPVAPRHKLPANPQMAQPIRPPLPEQPKPPEAVDVAPPVEAFSPAQPVVERLAEDKEAELVPVPIVPGRLQRQAAPPEPTRPPEPPAAAPIPEPAPPPVVHPPVPQPPVVQALPAAPPPTAQSGAVPRPATVPAAAPAAAPTAAVEHDFPKTIRDTLRRVDQAWAAFRAAALRFPSERMDERLGEDGWTVKQMLEHIAAWHDLTANRMIKMINNGEIQPLDRDTDQFNAAIARQAIGKTSGEVVKDLDATFNRLRRQLARLTDTQLAADDWWAAWVIGGNTYGHYEEHWADIYTPEPPVGSRSRR